VCGLFAVFGTTTKKQIVVLTQNLYLGADFAPLITAIATGDNVAAAAEAFLGTVLGASNNFNLRAPLIASGVNSQKPDLIGFQEVCTFKYADGSTAVDFRAALMPLLPDYEEVIYTSEGTFTVTGFGSMEIGNMIVQRKRPDLFVSNPQSGVYATVVTLPGGLGSIQRNWQTVNVRLEISTGTFADIVFFNTHLENDNPPVTLAQAQQLVNAGGALNTHSHLVALGDFNTDSTNQATYQFLTSKKQGNLVDLVRGVGNTCCRAELLTTTSPTLTFHIDLVLTNTPSIKLVSATRIGLSQVGGRYPSDHAGVVAKLQLP